MHTVSPAALSIGAGGFGAVYTLDSNERTAFKVVKNDAEEHRQYLEDEFHMMVSTYRYRLGKPQAFSIPAPMAYFQNSAAMEMFPSTDAAVDQSAFDELAASNAVYAMERIPSLPESLSQALLKEFAPTRQNERIVLSRLYLGRDKPITRTRFFNTRNFPVDLTGYNFLRSASGLSLPSAEALVADIGRMLATIHSAGFDARDVEFVLAGGSGKDDWGLYTFDFNQMQPLIGDHAFDLSLLVRSFYLNDPYFPRAHAGEPLFEAFKSGYLSMVDPARGDRTQAFFRDIIAEQTRRDLAYKYI